MSSGDKCGLLDIRLRPDYTSSPTAHLLKNKNTTNVDDEGICTESGGYKLNNTDRIEGYKAKGTATPIIVDQSNLLGREEQHQINYESFADEKNNPYAIRLFTEEDILNASDEISMSHVGEIDCIYEFEKEFDPNVKSAYYSDGVKIRPLNDLKDIMLKFRIKKGAVNPNVPSNVSHESPRNANMDIYLGFDDYPEQFCQCNNDAFVISKRTTKSPYVLESSLQETLNGGSSSGVYTFKQEREDLQTVLYKPVGGYDNVSSYSQLINQNSDLQNQLSILDLFEPWYHLFGMEYNYIINIEQNRNSNAYKDNPTIYDDAYVCGMFMQGKNGYNSVYSMAMDSLSSIGSCRRYCGIQNSQNNVLLKYYDDVVYDTNITSTDRQNSKVSRSYKYGGMKPYQKVEFYMPITSNKSYYHKSNLFSIKIHSTNLVEDDNARLNEIRRKIKKDINNGIRSLVDSICPVNTQLFNVYYLD